METGAKVIFEMGSSLDSVAGQVAAINDELRGAIAVLTGQFPGDEANVKETPISQHQKIINIMEALAKTESLVVSIKNATK